MTPARPIDRAGGKARREQSAGAEQALEANLAKYLPLWKLAVPPEFENFHPWDFSKFGRGERFVNKPLPHEAFDEVFAQVERWGLDQYLKDRNPEALSYSA